MSIDYSTYKFNYTPGGEFTLTGSDYIGYFNVDHGVAYTNRYHDLNSHKLVPTNRIKSDLYLSNLFQDRLIVDNLSLPNTLEELKIPVNELVTQEIFDRYLERVYENTLYLYSQLFIASNDLPVGYDAMAAVSGSDNEVKWIPQGDGQQIETNTYASVGWGEIDNVIASTVVPFHDMSGYAMFAISDTYFIALSSDANQTSITVTMSSNYIDNNTTKQYEGLHGISLSGDKLFITDKADNQVYKYDVRGFYNGDLSITNKRFLEEAIGGPGGIERKNKFNSPGAVSVADDTVYVVDENNKAIKVYDLNFVWRKTLSLRRENKMPCSISFYALHNLIYIVMNATDDSGDSELWITDKDLNIIEKVPLEGQLISKEQITPDANRSGYSYRNKDLGEKFCGVSFSGQDSNIFYVHSNKGIYKKFISRPDKTIGKWLFGNQGLVWYHIWNFEMVKFNQDWIFWNTLSGASHESFEVKGLTVIPQPGNGDTMFLFATTGTPPGARILHYDEVTLYDSTLYQTDLNLFTSTRQGQHKDEYVQGISFNKEIYKQTHNLLTIKNVMRGRFKGEFDFASNLIYKQYMYLQDHEIETIMIEALENLEIHDNEHVSAATINRIFTILYNIQQSILLLSETKITNLLPPPALTGNNIIVIE